MSRRYHPRAESSRARRARPRLHLARSRWQRLLIIALFVVGGAALATTLWKTSPNRAPTTELRSEMETGPKGMHQLALTFDLGGELGSVTQTLAALRATRTKATFFITGEWAQQYPEWVRQIAADQHEVGNHTWSHFDLTKLPDSTIRQELLATEKLLQSQTGLPIKPLWRAPFGERDQRVLGAAAAANYRSVYWSLDSLDSIDPPKTPEFLVHRVLAQSDANLDGAIVLMHASEPATAQALPRILAGLHERGFQCVRIGDWLRPR